MKTPDEQRSRIMRAVQSKDTKPEMLVRRALHRLSYRFRLHRNDLPGSPDIVFPGRRKVIFVHGCFWHGHSCKRGARQPKENADYWRAKIARNVARDREAQAALIGLGWTPLTVWECELRDDLEVSWPPFRPDGFKPKKEAWGYPLSIGLCPCPRSSPTAVVAVTGVPLRS